MIQKRKPATLAVLNILDWAHLDIAPYLAAMDSLSSGAGKAAEYEQRMVEFLRESHGLNNPTTTTEVPKQRKNQKLK